MILKLNEKKKKLLENRSIKFFIKIYTLIWPSSNFMYNLKSKIFFYEMNKN